MIATLAPQLHVGKTPPSAQRLREPKNSDQCLSGKPEGGFWTSTYSEQRGSDWVQWSLREDFGVPLNGWHSWLLTPRQDARLLTIDTQGDLRAMLTEYGREPRYSSLAELVPDFERLSRFYDGVRLTEDGQWATRLSTPYSLYGWDCESTLWLNWAFESVESLGVRTFEAHA